ncbi:MAG: hypothetical protein Q8S96_13340 [Hydrogenophaga sp.]|uniref:hypothetical protein n=1 Tax=Hydrogenophaga sp. TaxID=1904254 RepID=UPI002726575B|nr:hypothetical protein [Hydrogenophaga sp.]MDO9481644.1 hypothetical protein [Hydrogenophaga sp.]MDP3345421.1 hypothetical protein [Hydrogenophaga sp.]MDP3805263.1 hypothetical protein [Hydrogenophaga sp.]
MRQHLDDMPNQVHYRNDSTAINKDGKPIAALVDACLCARILETGEAQTTAKRLRR